MITVRRWSWTGVLTLLVASCGPPSPPAPAVQPDVVLITVDTLRADHLGVYGNDGGHTPSLDVLAGRGMVFTRASTPMPRTTPALASLLTGLEPRHHGSREVGVPLKAGTTLPEMLGAAGWSTLAVSASGAAGPAQGLDRGFEHFVSARQLSDGTAEVVTQRALALIDTKAAADRPLFLWVHYLDPHAPYRPPAPWGQEAAGDPCRTLEAKAEGEGWQAGHFFGDRDGEASRALASCSYLYNAEVAYVDRSIGLLLDGLAQRRDLDAAWLIMTADHGENLGEDGLFYQHGPSLHEASVRVPLLISGPGVASGRDDGIARLQDVAPTLVARLGLAPPPDPAFDGVDLSARLTRRGAWDEATLPASLMESGSALMVHNTRYLRSGRQGGLSCLNVREWSLCGSPGGPRTLHRSSTDPDLAHDLSAEQPRERRFLELAWDRWPAEAARDRAARGVRFKLVETPRAGGGWQRSLFDLEADPAESRDVRARYPREAARLGALLDAWTAELPDPAGGSRTAEELAALRALGYLD